MDINTLRYAAKMTKQQFANYFSVPKSTVEAWESGEEPCPDYLLQLIAYKLEKEGLALLPIELVSTNSGRRMADQIIL